MTCTKSITYDRSTRDYRMELDGRYVGHRSTYSQADHALTDMVYEMLTHGDTMTAEQLDGGQVCSTCGGDGDCPDCDAALTVLVATAIAKLERDQAVMEPLITDDPLGDQRLFCTDSRHNPPILTDCHAVISMALGNQPAKDVVPELRRVLARIETLLPTV